ncbi:MAG: hypothetical protein M3331_01085 [Actinomycetota bacterium]|nr:hypothetical protein [Actinomycetota bacterium]
MSTRGGVWPTTAHQTSRQRNDAARVDGVVIVLGSLEHDALVGRALDVQMRAGNLAPWPRALSADYVRALEWHQLTKSQAAIGEEPHPRLVPSACPREAVHLVPAEHPWAPRRFANSRIPLADGHAPKGVELCDLVGDRVLGHG